jgi:hypothetical protein
VDKNRPPSKLSHAAEKAPLDTVRGAVHRKLREDNDGNSGTEAANTLSQTAEGGYRAIETAHRSHAEKPYRRAEKAEAAADKANLRALNRKYEQEYGKATNPYSKWQQKRAIKKEYAAAKAGNGARNTAKASEATAKAARRAAEDTKKAGSFIVRHKKGFLIVGGIAAVILLLMTGISSCSTLFQGATSGIVSSTYPLEDADMLAAEAAYCGMEQELKDRLDNYEAEHDYDEYHFDLDEIEHDPYVLLSIISAWHEGEWTLAEVQDTLQMLFDRQYILTEDVVVEVRYRTETRTDSEGNDYDVEVPYNYYICTLTLSNENLSHLPVYIMGEEQLSRYALYMATLGNRPDLFPGSDYVGKYTGDPVEHEVPEEYLVDETFSALLTEAEKYIGYPYVWGGSSPSTSFDCSGYLSWVLNQCGWNVGRLGAQGLYNYCTPTSSPQPGDLVFFVGTYDTPGVSHCGLYVGDGWMLHCGDPISYTNLNSSYWQSHFYAYGRLP